MTAPDLGFVQQKLLEAAALIERRAYVAAEIVRLQTEAAEIDIQISTTWPDQISAVVADMNSLVQQVSDGS